MPSNKYYYNNFINLTNEEQASILSSITVSKKSGLNLYKKIFSRLESNQKAYFLGLENFSYFLDISSKMNNKLLLYCLRHIDENQIEALITEKDYYLLRLISSRFNQLTTKAYFSFLPDTKKIEALKSDNFRILKNLSDNRDPSFLEDCFLILDINSIIEFLSSNDFFQLKKASLLGSYEVLKLYSDTLPSLYISKFLLASCDIFISLAEFGYKNEFLLLFSYLSNQQKVNLVEYEDYLIPTILSTTSDNNGFLKEIISNIDEENIKKVISDNDFHILKLLFLDDLIFSWGLVSYFFEDKTEYNEIAKIDDFYIPKLLLQNDKSLEFFIKLLNLVSKSTISEMIKSENYFIISKLVEAGNFNIANSLVKFLDNSSYDEVNSILNFIFRIDYQITTIAEETEEDESDDNHSPMELYPINEETSFSSSSEDTDYLLV